MRSFVNGFACDQSGRAAAATAPDDFGGRRVAVHDTWAQINWTTNISANSYSISG